MVSGCFRKRVLVLGATENQVPVIKEIQRRGLVPIVADNNPANPGHQFASRSFNISTTDSDSLISLGRQLQIDAVIAHGTDPGALSAARIAFELGLPGDDLGAVTLVQDKISLRKLQVELGLAVPAFIHAMNVAELADFFRSSPYGIIVKPADGSGSRGISRLSRGSRQEDVEAAFELGLGNSRSGRIIAEQLLPHEGTQLGGDLIFSGGEIRQVLFSTQYMAHNGTGLAVTANLVPTTYTEVYTRLALEQLKELTLKSGLLQGIYNFEFVARDDGTPVLVDFGARSGGGLYSELFYRAYNIDTVSINIDFALGLSTHFNRQDRALSPVLGITLHSPRSGHFRQIRFSAELETLIVTKAVRTQPGEPVKSFTHSGHRVGMVIAASSNYHQLRQIAERVYDHFHVELQGGRGIHTPRLGE